MTTYTMFTSLLINATRRRRGHIPRLLLRYSRVIFNIRTQKRILQLLSEDEFSRIPRLQPVFPFKYLHENYLATGLSIEQKAQALLTHYRVLKSYFNRESLGKLLYEPLTVFSANTDSNAYIDIVLLVPHTSRIEGELSLLLKLNEINTFTLSFTIVPGQVVCCAEERVFLVSRVQGERCVQHEVRTVTKALWGVSPPMALLDALQGIASALCINHLAAVPAVQQSYFSEEHAQTFLKSYDEFFLASGLTRGAGGFFEAPFPLPKKPLGAIKSGNRPRAKAQREIRAEIAETVRQVMMQHRRA